MINNEPYYHGDDHNPGGNDHNPVDHDSAVVASQGSAYHLSTVARTERMSILKQTRLFPTPESWTLPSHNQASGEDCRDDSAGARLGVPARRPSSSNNVCTTTTTTTTTTRCTMDDDTTTATTRTRFTRLSNKRQRRLPSTAHRMHDRPRTSSHVVCAMSENLARETCLAVIDATAPTTLMVCKQGNGQAYTETMACLQQLQPDEILLNEGRRTSPLIRKVLELYHHDPQPATAVDWTQFKDPPMTGVPGANRHPRRRHGLAKDPSRYERDDPFEPDARHNDSPPRRGERSPTSTTVVKFVSRGLFDQTRGAALLRKIVRDDAYDPTVVEEYILLSSAHAVLTYLQSALGAHLTSHSLVLHICAGGVAKNRMAIDRTTLWQLELLANSKTGKSQHSLIGTINRTKTTVGSRLLRSNFIAPPAQLDTIHSRLELVETFLSDEDFFFRVYDHLKALPDVDTMLANIALAPHPNDTDGADEPSDKLVRRASKGIAALVSIKAVLTAIPSLVGALQGHLDQHQTMGMEPPTPFSSRSSLRVGLGSGIDSHVPQRPSASTRSDPIQSCHLLQAIAAVLKEPQLQQVLQLVTSVFTESTTYSRNANTRQHQECFALKDNQEDGIMTFLRNSYKENVDSIYKEADALAEEHNLLVTVRYTLSRGYFLSVPASSTDLPSSFLHPTKSGRYISFETLDVASWNSRAMGNVRDLLVMTYSRIQSVLADAREQYDALASLCDAIALLDMCHSFADVVSMSALPWCRPLVFLRKACDVPQDSYGRAGRQRALVIRNGWYPVAMSDSSSTELVLNDTFASEDTSFTVISGINGSGKSTYLKQIATISVLAHIGCFVPAEQASIPLVERLCTRIGNADDQEHNISTFMLEMKETAFICANATVDSLILLDELGRATSNEDGVAIAWAVSEYLLSRRSLVFCVTHYPQLCMLADTYPTVQNVHLEANVTSVHGCGLSYTHKVKAGACKVSSEYGVELASYCGWTNDVQDRARDFENRLRALLPADCYFSEPGREREVVNTTRKAAFATIMELSRDLKHTCQESPRAMSTSALLSAFIAIQSKFHARCIGGGRGFDRCVQQILDRKTTAPGTERDRSLNTFQNHRSFRVDAPRLEAGQSPSIGSDASSSRSTTSSPSSSSSNSACSSPSGNSDTISSKGTNSQQKSP